MVAQTEEKEKFWQRKKKTATPKCDCFMEDEARLELERSNAERNITIKVTSSSPKRIEKKKENSHTKV